jgi:transposase InsO family protein
MTESYDPYQNAVAERVNGILKQEFLIHIKNININTMRTIVKQSIEIYNQYRPHWSCNMLTPNQMHKQKNIKIKTYKNKNPQELQLLGI